MLGCFYCKGCAAEITGEISIESLKDPSVKRPEMLDQQPVCDVGAGYKSYEPLQRSFDPENPDDLEFSPQFN